MHHREWISCVSHINCLGLRSFDFSSEAGYEQLVCRSIHRSGNCLDLVFADTPGVDTYNIGIPIGPQITVMFLLLLELS